MNFKVLDVPVHYKEKFSGVCASHGFLWWKWIVVGPVFTRLPGREQEAILLHEVGHVKLWHVEKRTLMLWLIVWPPLLARYCKAQEFQADFYAKECGYGPDLARFFSRLAPESRPFHPSPQERITRLQHLADLTPESTRSSVRA